MWHQPAGALPGPRFLEGQPPLLGVERLKQGPASGGPAERALSRRASQPGRASAAISLQRRLYRIGREQPGGAGDPHRSPGGEASATPCLSKWSRAVDWLMSGLTDSSTNASTGQGRPNPRQLRCATVMRLRFGPPPSRACPELVFQRPIKAAARCDSRRAPAWRPRRRHSRPGRLLALSLLRVPPCAAGLAAQCAARWPSTTGRNRPLRFPLNPSEHRENNKTLSALKSSVLVEALLASERQSLLGGIPASPDSGRPGPGSPTCWAAGCWRGGSTLTQQLARSLYPTGGPGRDPCVRQMAEIARGPAAGGAFQQGQDLAA